MKKHVYLSKKSLERIWDWAEINVIHNPLANAYMSACGLVGSIDSIKLADRLSKLWKEKNKYKRYDATLEMLNDAIIIRDKIGRIILKVLKKEDKRRIECHEKNQLHH